MKQIFTIFIVLFSTLSVFSQDEDTPKETDGVAISPSSLRFNTKPGTTTSKEVKITNNSKQTYKFQINFSDFMMGVNGNAVGIKPEESKYSLSKWVSASPSYFEVKAGEVKKITVTIDIPNNDTANIAAWTIMMIDQVIDRTQKLDPVAENKNTISMGILPSFGFGVYIYQNPPNVKTTLVEIQNFNYFDQNSKKNLKMHVKNVGDGIGFCLNYVEITNLSNGVQKKLPTKRNTILPGFTRDFVYPLPDTIAAGKYSAIGVLDFGSKTQIETAELEFEIKK